MFEKLKRFSLHFFVLGVNVVLVVGGVFFVKNKQQEKTAAQALANDVAANAEANQAQVQIAEQAAELQKIVEQNKDQKNAVTSNNPATVTVQKPKTVTQTVPAVTSKVEVPAKSSSSSSTTSSASKTTKTS